MPSSVTLIARRQGKKYEKAKSLVERKNYTVAEATALLPKLSTTAFDATAEIHVRVNADTTQADQLVRTAVTLPHGTGRKVRVAAFVPDDQVAEAKKAGADLAGNEDIIKRIEEGHIDFDVAVASPKVMKDLGKVAKILGQKGMMPSPKAGTVTDKIAKVIEELKRGRIELKMDKNGIIHSVFGKLSFGPEKLKENLEVVLNALREARPSGIKGEYVLSVTLCPTMGPGIRVQF